MICYALNMHVYVHAYILGWMKHTYNRLIPIQNRKASPIMLLRCPAKFQTILINLVWGRTPPPWGMGWRCFQAFLKAASHASLPLCMMWKNMIKYLLLVCTRLYSHSVSLLVSRLVGQSVHPKSMKSSQISTKRLFQRWKHATNDPFKACMSPPCL